MKLRILLPLFFLLTACQPQTAPTAGRITPLPSATFAAPTLPATQEAQATESPPALVPQFKHIVWIVFEHKDFNAVIGNADMPYFNLLAGTFTLLTQHYAASRENEANYLALIGGDTFESERACGAEECLIAQASLPDLIESNGRSWRAYLDDMPEPCFTQDTPRYLTGHNPFIFFESIRANAQRCRERVVPLTYLDGDLAVGYLPNFIYIAPDICYTGRDCGLDLVDGWLKQQVEVLYPALESTGEPFLMILTWDQGQASSSEPGGRVATALLSPQVKRNYQDDTRYSHYSLLKTIAAAWGFSAPGKAAQDAAPILTAPWR